MDCRLQNRPDLVEMMLQLLNLLQNYLSSISPMPLHISVVYDSNLE